MTSSPESSWNMTGVVTASTRLDSVDLAKTIAVLTVFLYHSPFFQLTSGFLGVDIFLVVTGYLSAASIQRSGPSVFIVKRLIRVWPSLSFTLLLTFLMFQYIMYYSEIRQLSRDSVLANIFLSNFGTYYLTGGYFDETTQFSPLFHLWSISLEIQLWFIFALLIQCSRRYGFITVFFLGVVSFLYSVSIMMTSESIDEFYLLPLGRFWEAALGYCMFFQSGRIRIANSTLLALVVLLLGIMILDVNRYRLLWYIFVFISLLLLVSEIELGRRVGGFVRYISKRTYGIYLFHLPVIVLFDTYMQLNSYVALSLVLASTIAYANFSYRYLET